MDGGLSGLVVVAVRGSSTKSVVFKRLAERTGQDRTEHDGPGEAVGGSAGLPECEAKDAFEAAWRR